MASSTIQKRLIAGLQMAALAVFLLLAHNNWVLRREVDGMRAALLRSHRDASSRTLRPGERVDGIPLRNLKDEVVILDPKAAPVRHLVAVINPACSACGDMARDLERISSGRGSDRVWVISLRQPSETEAFAARYRLEASTYRLADGVSSIHRFKLSTYPQAFVLAPPGIVLKRSDKVSDCLPAFTAATRSFSSKVASEDLAK